MEQIHFIAIGGAVMHNLAIALHQKGYKVTGSDDEIFEPARSRLDQNGLLPHDDGWFEQRIHPGLSAVILGMHARADNPELIRARELGIKVFSFPEYIFEQSKNKTRVVIGGSHGKTTITAMIMHVLRKCALDFDYMVGSQLEGFDTMVRLTNEAPVIVLEGDEYLTSPLDPRPKFHVYLPHIALLSGVAWDHINVFPTFEKYTEQFSIFISLIRERGSLIYCEEDLEVKRLAAAARPDIVKYPYHIPSHRISNGVTILQTEEGEFSLQIFGTHNLMNLEGARLVCGRIGVSRIDFYKAIQSFKGAAKRLECVAQSGETVVFKDFAHSPSKLRATVNAVREQYPERKLVACMELHTFSSLNRNFLDQFRGSMDAADVAIVYFNPHTLEHKKLEAITPEMVAEAFGKLGLLVLTDSAELEDKILSMDWKRATLLMMSSGNFDGLDIKMLASKIL